MFTNIKGIQIAYTDEGEGPPMLFVHGFPLSHAAWSKQIEFFKSSHRVIAPDLRGFGESESSPDLVAMSTFAEDLHTLIQHLDTGPVVLVGHSMGGYVALAFAKAFPESLRGLVLVGTKAGMDTPDVAMARRATAVKVKAEGPSAVVDAMASKMLSKDNVNPAMAASVHGFMTPPRAEGIIGALLGMAERPDANAWIGDIQVPTLVVVGSDDIIIPPAESEAMVKSIPGAKFKSIPKAGHLVAFECPDAFNEAVSNWLAWGREVPEFGASASMEQ